MIRAAVLGKPIEHSLSPLVHGLIYDELGLEHQYLRFELDAQEALDFLSRELKRGWSGFSLTMPLKEVGFSLDLPVDDLAQRSRSINTITHQGSFNTDITGLIRVIERSDAQFSQVVLFGNGATSRSALVALELFGYRGEVTLLRRDEKKDSLLPKSEVISLKLTDSIEGLNGVLSERTLIISTVPSAAQASFSRALVDFCGTLVDFTYSPWPSTLAGVSRGLVISGLPILVSQAVDQARLFTNVTFDLDSMYERVLSSTVRILASR